MEGKALLFQNVNKIEIGNLERRQFCSSEISESTFLRYNVKYFIGSFGKDVQVGVCGRKKLRQIQCS